MGNRQRRLNRRQNAQDEQPPPYIIVPIKQADQIVNFRRTGMQPFPALPAFSVAITILKFAGTVDQVMQLLQVASHTSRAYCFHHERGIKQEVTHALFGSLTRSAIATSTHLPVGKDVSWPTKEIYEEVMQRSKSVKLEKLIVQYAYPESFAKDPIIVLAAQNQEKEINEIVSQDLEAEKYIQSISVELSNGMKSPEVPFNNPQNKGKQVVLDMSKYTHIEKVIVSKMGLSNNQRRFNKIEVVGSVQLQGDEITPEWKEHTDEISEEEKKTQVLRSFKADEKLIGIRQKVSKNDVLFSFEWISHKSKEHEVSQSILVAENQLYLEVL